MPLRWKLFRILCIFQLILVSFVLIRLMLTHFLPFRVITLLLGLVYLLAFLLAALGGTLINSNYPDTPVVGPQKRWFNRLFLLNFLMLSVHFGRVIADIRSLQRILDLFDFAHASVPWRVWAELSLNPVMLIFQLLILFGLYKLRRELSANFAARSFEFEKPQ